VTAKTIKVLHVTTHFDVGGITNYILTLSGAMKARGVDVVVASAGGALKGELKRLGIPHADIDIKTKFEFGPKVIRSAFAVARIVREEKIDLMHAHTRVSQVAALLASAMTGVPFVTTCHGYFRKRLRGIVDTWGTKVVAISAAVRAHLLEDMGVRPDRVELIQSGVDTARFSGQHSPEDVAALRRELGLKPGPVVGTIGRLSPVKGHRYLVGAMKTMLEKRPDCQAVLLGDGPERDNLEKIAASLGISSSVRFYPSCPDTARFLAAMDVFVFPSVKEGLGIALLEALAAGKACVASRVGGIEDIITDGYNGLLVGVGDRKAIAEAVLELLSDDKLRGLMGSRGRDLVGEKFTLDSMAGSMADLYRRVTGSPSGR
jgi:glycosyltransferase involved in cell wall biosynthesis